MCCSDEGNKNEMELTAEMVNFIDTDPGVGCISSTNPAPLIPGFDPKTIVDCMYYRRAIPISTDDDDDAVPSSFEWFSKKR